MVTFSERYDAIERIRAGLAEESLRSLQSEGYYQSWIQKEVQKALEASKGKMGTARDGISIGHLYKVTKSQPMYERCVNNSRNLEHR